MIPFGWRHFLNDKRFLHVHRVGRVVSKGSSSLWIVFQAIMISPRISGRRGLKWTPKYISTSTALCWILPRLVNTIFLMYITRKWSNKKITNRNKFGYCSSVRHDKARGSMYAELLPSPDVLCSGLRLWVGSCVVFIHFSSTQYWKS